MKYRALLPPMVFAVATVGLGATAVAAQHESDMDKEKGAVEINGVEVKVDDNWQIFMELDADNDGVITREEAASLPEVEDQFDDLDDDGSDDLTRSEFEDFKADR